MDNKRFEEVFGNENLRKFKNQQETLSNYDELCGELSNLNKELKQVYCVDVSLPDILIATSAGIICGGVNGLFKSTVPQHGSLKHEHSTTRTAVDYKVAKPKGMHGSIQGLHRQIGPGHDVGRFKEALDLMSGKTTDFPLWGKDASAWTGGLLHPGNMRLEKFVESGGFKIPNDPKAELMNHLVIDFFTKTSLPLPFSSYIADCNQALAKLMIIMYDEGLNCKNIVGNTLAVTVLQIIMHGYAFLFKALPHSGIIDECTSIQDFPSAISNLISCKNTYTNSNDFHVLQMIAHGSSFILDTLITTGSQNYTGLLSLNYGSVLLFAKHTLQYVFNCSNKRKEILSNIAQTNNSLDSINNKWYDTFKNNVISTANSNQFFDTFNPDSILERHNIMIEKMQNIQQLKNKHDEQLKFLKEWNI